MFATLIESGGRTRTQSRWLPASAAIHLALLTGLAAYPANRSPRPTVTPEPATLIWVTPSERTNRPDAPSGGSSIGSTSPNTGKAARPAFGEGPMIDVADIPLPGETGTEQISPSTSFGDATAIGTPGTMGAPGGGPLSATQVDRVALPHSDNRRPAYPGSLQAAGVEGSVTMRFVIDTIGSVETGSRVVVWSDHPLFTAAVMRALAQHRFLPAEAGGRRVRMLVEQRFEFTLVPR